MDFPVNFVIGSSSVQRERGSQCCWMGSLWTTLLGLQLLTTTIPQALERHSWSRSCSINSAHINGAGTKLNGSCRCASLTKDMEWDCGCAKMSNSNQENVISTLSRYLGLLNHNVGTNMQRWAILFFSSNFQPENISCISRKCYFDTGIVFRIYDRIYDRINEINTIVFDRIHNFISYYAFLLNTVQNEH